MKKIFPTLFFVAAAICCYQSSTALKRWYNKPPATTMLISQNKPLPVLIVDGFSNHDWKQTTALTKWILEASGLFTVSVSTIPSDSIQRLHWTPEFKDYAVVVQNTNNIHDTTLRWPVHAERSLEKYVKAGGGLYILHSANNAFSHWKEYDKMIGLGWRPATVGYALEIDAKKKYCPSSSW